MESRFELAGNFSLRVGRLFLTALLFRGRHRQGEPGQATALGRCDPNRQSRLTRE